MVQALMMLMLLAGTPTFKGNKMLDDGAPALSVKSIKVPGGLSSTTVSTLDGAVVVVFNLSAPYQGQRALAADFQGLGVNFNAMVAEDSVNAVLEGWWAAGALSAQGANKEALSAWAASRNIQLVDTAAEQAALEKAMASRPAPSASSSGSGSSTSVYSYSAPSKTTTSSASPSSSAPAKPSVVSISMHITCSERVRVFTGASKSSGGTYGWESPNSTRSLSAKPGSVICVADASDHVKSCWTVGEERADVNIDCSGVSER